MRSLSHWTPCGALQPGAYVLASLWVVLGACSSAESSGPGAEGGDAGTETHDTGGGGTGGHAAGGAPGAGGTVGHDAGKAGADSGMWDGADSGMWDGADSGMWDGADSGGHPGEAGAEDAGAVAADVDKPDGDAGSATCTPFSTATTSAPISASEIAEASGLAASRAHAGVLYIHNDSGDSARFFALKSDGTYLGQWALTGATFTDCEDMALGPNGDATWIYLGDTGDNAARTGEAGQRSSVNVYRLPEPELPATASFTVPLDTWEKLTLVYPDKPHDSEALMVDPRSGDLYLVTKELDGKSTIWRAPAPLSTAAPITLEAVGALHFGAAPLTGDLLATGGDMSPEGDAVLIRTYDTAFLFPRGPLETVSQALAGTPLVIPLLTEPKGEAIGFAADGASFFTASEGASQPLHRFSKTCAP